MGLMVYPGEMKIQAQTMNEALNLKNDCLLGVASGVESFTADTELTGSAWAMVKDQLSAHLSVIHGIICCNEAIVNDNSTMIGILGDEDLNEDEINNQIEALQQVLNRAEQMKGNLRAMQSNPVIGASSAPFIASQMAVCEGIIAVNESMIKTLEAKLQKLYDINNQTMGLFSNCNALSSTVNQGITAISGSWNGTGFNLIPAGDWQTKINDVWSDQTEKWDKAAKDYMDELVKRLPHLSEEELRKLMEMVRRSPCVELPEKLIDGLKTSIAEFPDDFKQETGLEVLGKILESGGENAGRIGGWINYITGIKGPVGANSFVIVDEEVSKLTTTLVQNGGKLAAFGKYGVPIIGAVIDFGAQVASGEDVVDAGVKAGAHLAIGIGAGKVGALIGTALCPGLGTVVGGAIGFVAGAVISVVGGYIFDTIYDNRKAIADTAKEVVSTVGKGIEDVGDAIGDAVSSFGRGLGTIFG